MNICGCLIHIAPDRRADARQAIEAHAGAEVYSATDDGRFVVVVEDTTTMLASETIMALHQIPGVLSLTLNFHHFETPSDTLSALTPTPATPDQRPVQ